MYNRHLILSFALLAGCIQAPTILPMDVSATQEVDEQEVDDCSICLVKLSCATTKLPCNHSFHRKCLLNLCNILDLDMLNETLDIPCPLCRAPIPPEIEFQLRETITCKEHLNDLGGYLLYLLSRNNLKNFKEAVKTITSCDEELIVFKSCLDTTDEACNAHLLPFKYLIAELTAEHLSDGELLQKLYNRWRPLTQSQLVFFLKDLIEAYDISEELITQIRTFIEQQPQGEALLEEIDPALDIAQELVGALRNAPGRAFYHKLYQLFSERTLFEVLEKSDIPTLLEHLSLALYYLSESLEPLEENREVHVKLLELLHGCYLSLHEKALTLPDFTQLLSGKLHDERLPFKKEAALPLIRKLYTNQFNREQFTQELSSELDRIERTPLEVLQPPVQDNPIQNNNPEPEVRQGRSLRPLHYFVAYCFICGGIKFLLEKGDYLNSSDSNKIFTGLFGIAAVLLMYTEMRFTNRA